MEPERNGLRVRYEYRDADGTGVFSVQARFAGFAGASQAWFGEADVLHLADQLRSCPLGEPEPRISGGYRRADGSIDEHVGLTVRPIGHRGSIGVTAHLATPADSAESGAPVSEARVQVLTSYEALGRFSTELIHLVAGRSVEAWLDADPVGAG